MSALRRIARNTAILFISQIIIQLMTLLLAIVIARRLGVEGFGTYSFAVAYATIIISMVAELGYQTLLVREVSKNHDDARTYLDNVLGVRIILTVAAFLVVIVTINLMGYPEDIKIVTYLFSASALISSLSGVFLVTFRAFQRMEYEAISTIVEGALRMVLGLMVLFMNRGLEELGIVFVFSSLVGFVVSAVLCKWKFVPARPRFDLSFFKKTIGVAVTLAVLPMLAIMYIRADTVILSLMKGQDVVGWYNAAYNIVLTLKMVPILLMTALFPAAVSVSVNSRELYSLYYEKAIKYLVALGIPMTIGLAVLAEQIILITYGVGYENSIQVLAILSFDCLLMFIYQPLANALIGYGKERQVAVSAGLCLGLNVVMNILLIPKYGMLAAAVVTVLSEIVLLISNLHFYHKSIGHFSLPKFFLKPLIASLPMLGLLLFLNINILILVPLSVGVYFVVFFLIGGLDGSEEQALRSFFATIRGRFSRTRSKS